VGCPDFISGDGGIAAGTENGQREGWDSTPIVSLWIIFGVALGVFLLVEPHAKTPVVDLRAFRSSQYAIGISLCFIAGAMFNGGPFLLSLPAAHV
jgi:hypothetical protein